MGDHETFDTWSEIRSWAALGMAVVGVVGLLWGRKAGVVARFKDPITHKIVCQCLCRRDLETGGAVGITQTFEERADCGALNGVTCEIPENRDGTLEGCHKRSVEVERERVQGERPLVKG
jgi:hypothetical protein